jgi:4-amino-4-deoxy-L-arabinose transferase-like glycosyltransferase
MGQSPAGGGQGTLPGTDGRMGQGGQARQGNGGGMGGLLGGADVSAEAEALLEKNAEDYTWAAAAIGSQNAASYQLATERPVMAIGGFNGSDPSPTLAQFKKYVADGEIHYFIAGGGRGGGPGGNGSSEITTWVEETFTEVTVGEVTFYDLTAAK